MRSRKKLKTFAVHVYIIIMVMLRSQNKITDFLMILAWASPFHLHQSGRNTRRAWLKPGQLVCTGTVY